MNLADIARFYELLSRLEARVGGARVLAHCTGRVGWPRRGVYFFLEDGEVRTGLDVGRRVVRVGTHGLQAGARSTLWGRLSQHRGSMGAGGGNHRGSIFRLLVGDAPARRGDVPRPASWGRGSDVGAAARMSGLDQATIRRNEAELEMLVSKHIRAMPFLWLDVDDAPGPGSRRAVIERNAIALLSQAPPCDPPSDGWLGRNSSRENVRRSGLWNNRHVGQAYDPSFLDLLEAHVDGTRPL